MRLSRSVIWVLPKDDDLHPVQRGQVQRAKIFVALGEDVLPPRLLLDEEGFQRLHVRAVELVLQRLQPAWVQPYRVVHDVPPRSEEHTSELQSLMRISYAVFCLKKKQNTTTTQ